MKARVLRPDLVFAKDLDALEHFASEVLYYRMMLAADDSGWLHGETHTLADMLFPREAKNRLRKITASDVEAWLNDLSIHGMIKIATWNGGMYYWVPDVVHTDGLGNKARSRYEISQHQDEVVHVATVAQARLSISGDLDVSTVALPELRGTAKREFEIVVESTKTLSQKRKSYALGESWDRFWSAYPRRQAKADASKAWVQVRGDEHVGEILKALEWQRKRVDWTKEDGKFVPLPGSWLRGRRWEDEPPTTVQQPAPPSVSVDDQAFYKEAMLHRMHSMWPEFERRWRAGYRGKFRDFLMGMVGARPNVEGADG